LGGRPLPETRAYEKEGKKVRGGERRRGSGSTAFCESEVGEMQKKRTRIDLSVSVKRRFKGEGAERGGVWTLLSGGILGGSCADRIQGRHKAQFGVSDTYPDFRGERSEGLKNVSRKLRRSLDIGKMNNYSTQRL